MRIDILTIFPGLCSRFCSESLVGSARERGLLDIRLHDFRVFAKGAHQAVDDKPFGGGPGMVLKPEPICECIETLLDGLDRRPRMILP